jgi:hypothetical protein
VKTVLSSLMLAAFLACPVLAEEEQLSPGKPPVIGVYGRLGKVENVTVAITNPNHDRAISILSLELEGQLPDLKYFYKGITGDLGLGIRKLKKKVVIFQGIQCTTRPLERMFLLPFQSASWTRPMRVQTNGYKAVFVWKEYPRDKIGSRVWYLQKRLLKRVQFAQLTENRWQDFRNKSAGKRTPELILTEEVYPRHTGVVFAPYRPISGHDEDPDERTTWLPVLPVKLWMPPLLEEVTIESGKVIVRKFNPEGGIEEPVQSIVSDPRVIDILYLAWHSKEKVVPCILAPEVYGGLMAVKKPGGSAKRFLPGITNVPLAVLPKLFNKAKEKGHRLEYNRIDPNGYNRIHVLTLGVDVDSRGRRVVKENQGGQK